ncbi:1815_t:CDS:1, partial [Scutellospora calospora]
MFSQSHRDRTFSIESKFSSSETDSKALKESFIKALKNMRSICEQVNGKYNK